MTKPFILKSSLIFPLLSKFIFISTTKKPSLITLSNMNNSIEFSNDLVSFIISLSLIAFVDIFKSSIENSLLKKDLRDMFVLMLSNSNLLSSIW